MKKQITALLCALILSVFLSACSWIQDGPEIGSTVYLPEDGADAAYVVVSRDSAGRLLVLRCRTLPQQLPFGPGDSGYYAGSAPDAYLDEQFFGQLPPQLQACICPAELEICRKFPDNSSTEQITRRIFLLSATEVGLDLEIVTEEGSCLDYFRDPQHRQTDAWQQSPGWWLRSDYTPDRGLAWHIQPDGTVGGRPVWQPSGLRPAFWLSEKIRWQAEPSDGYRPDFSESDLKAPQGA